MLFKIIGIREGIQKNFYYDNIENVLKDESGKIYEKSNNKNAFEQKKYTEFSPENPLKKSSEVHTLKIQLGLTCNYSCEYCSQRFVERAPETSRKHISDFLDKIKNLNFNEKNGLRVELWGGEPFLYWKTIKPLVAELKEHFSHWKRKPEFSIISNGSLLTDEICDWIVENLKGFAISHDGPGQAVRGPDPLEDEKTLELALKLYDRMNGRMSFNCMINANNMSRKEVHEWFVKKTGRKNIKIGEGAFVDAYDEGGISMSLDSKQKHFEYRRLAFKEIYESDGELGFTIVKNKIQNFEYSLLTHQHADYVTQKCGMDDENTIAVDLKGNVLTCQNVSHVAINANGESHNGGNIDDIENVRLTSSYHWTQRKECIDCPVLHLCRGACMYAANQYWDQTCNNSYSDNIVFFAATFEKLTGYIPLFIDNDVLPDMRKDIWGSALKHEDEPKKKTFPIPVVAG